MRIEHFKNHHITLLDEIELEKFAPGTREDRWLTLIDDALGRPFRLPISIAKGAKDGPIFGITAAVHGNELNGIPVIHELLNTINLKNLKGTILALIVTNTPAFLAGRRTFVTGADLNHCMPGTKGGSMEYAYAFEIMRKFTNKLDYLVDLHTASVGRVNTLYVRADMKNEFSSKMARLQRPQIIVHNPASDHTLRGAAMAQGIPAITVEIGNPGRFQKGFIKNTIGGIRNILGSIGMLPVRTCKILNEPVVCSKSYWLYTGEGGLLEVFPELGDFVKKDEYIAEIKTIFGDPKVRYYAPEDGIIVGRSVNPVAETGARILHIGIPQASHSDLI